MCSPDSITRIRKLLVKSSSAASHSRVGSYGEINCVVQIDKTAELMGMQGWQGAGWTSPGPGTHQ